jgi:hypothetical protein
MTDWWSLLPWLPFWETTHLEEGEIEEEDGRQ